jgi:hypothetical protein
LSAEEFEEKLSMMKPLDLRLKVGTLTAISGSVVFEAGGCTVAAECDIVEADSAVPVDARPLVAECHRQPQKQCEDGDQTSLLRA